MASEPTRIQRRPPPPKVERKPSEPTKPVNTMERLKVVVRRLPPCITEEEFKDMTSGIVDYNNLEWFEFIKGKVFEDYNKEKLNGRCYLKFKSSEPILALGQALSGKVMQDSKGNQTLPSVEFAPYQRIPRPLRKTDTRIGTIVEDPDYIAFLESLNSPPPKEDITEKLDTIEKVTTTPLIEFIRQQKAASAANLQSTGSEKSSGTIGKERSRERRRGRGRGKEKEKATEKPIAPPIVPKLLARKKSSASESASTEKSTTPTAPAAAAREREKRAPRPSAVAAILQRDLGLGSGSSRRRDRGGDRGGASTAAAKPTPVDTSRGKPSASTSTPATPTASTPTEAPTTPTDGRRTRRRPPRGGKAREEAEAGQASPSQANPPIAALRKQNTMGANVAPKTPAVLRRQNTAPSTSANNPPPAPSPAVTPPVIPTGPKGAKGNGPPHGRGGRLSGLTGAAIARKEAKGISPPKPQPQQQQQQQQQTQTQTQTPASAPTQPTTAPTNTNAPVVPTGPAAGPHGPRGSRRGGNGGRSGGGGGGPGMFRGGRGGGGGGRGGMHGHGPRNQQPPPAPVS